MAVALVLVVLLAVWTPLSTAQSSCDVRFATFSGPETGSMSTPAECFQCLGRSCNFAYFSTLLPNNPCRQILPGSPSSPTTAIGFTQCTSEEVDCDSPQCNGTCSPCVSLREVFSSQDCSVTEDGFRVCQQSRCLTQITRIRVTSLTPTTMPSTCASFCGTLTGCQAFVRTSTVCFPFQFLPDQPVTDLLFAVPTRCRDETETDYCFASPCQNGGICVNRTENFECFCALGFTGPTCGDIARAVIGCPGVVTTPGVTAMVANYSVGSNVTFLCLDNFLPVSGDALQTCLANLTWTGSPLMCDPVVTYTVRFRALGRASGILSLTLFGNQTSSPTVNLRLVGWGFFARGVSVFVRSTDLGPLQRAVVELITGVNSPRARLALQMLVTAPDGATFSFPTTTLAGGDVRDLPATLLRSSSG